MKRLATLTLLATLSAAAHAGVVYEVEVKDHEQNPPKTESIQAAVEGRFLKMGVASGGSSGGKGEMIFRGDRREVVVVDHDNKSYHLIDKAAIDSIAGQVGGAMKQMEEMMKSLPKEQQDAINRARASGVNIPGMPAAGAKPSPTTLRKTGETGTQAGYPCVKYEVVRDGRVIRELWVTDWSNVEGSKEIQGAFEDMADFFQEMQESLSEATGPMGGFGGLSDNPYQHMKEIGGFPVVTREFGDDGSLEGESTLRGSQRRTLDPADFEPPAGYKRQEMFSPGG